jgi:hypothetical protein
VIRVSINPDLDSHVTDVFEHRFQGAEPEQYILSWSRAFDCQMSSITMSKEKERNISLRHVSSISTTTQVSLQLA